MEEKYEFTWTGKQEAAAEIFRPTGQVFCPCTEESVCWDSTGNFYLEGDNLSILKLLQGNYRGRIKMIYIDPPYNTGSDTLVYTDRFGSRGQQHSVWCSMIYPRLLLARELLTDDGVIFLSIDDHEFENLKKICDEVFGEQNHCGTFIVNAAPNARDYGHIAKMHEFCLFYAKNLATAKTNLLPDADKKFKYQDAKGGYNIHPLYNSNEAFHAGNRPNLYYPFYLYLDEPLSDGFYKIGLEPKAGSIELYPPKSIRGGVQFVWRWSRKKARQFLNEEIIGYQVREGEYRIVQKMRHREKVIRSLLTDKKYASRSGTAQVQALFGAKVFSFPKPLALLLDLCRVGMGKEDLVLDFFSGSATTAHAVMLLNAMDGGSRKFIMVQRPERTDPASRAYQEGYTDICEIGRKRIRLAADRIREEYPQAVFDGGFQVWKLAEEPVPQQAAGSECELRAVRRVSECEKNGTGMEYRPATEKELEQIWQYNICEHPGDQRWVQWKKEFMDYNREKKALTFLVLDNGTPVGEGTLLLSQECHAVAGRPILCDGKKRANVHALRIQKAYEGKGHISRLIREMESCARKYGITGLTIGVEAKETRNLAIYLHLGFLEFLFSQREDGELVFYFGKDL